MRSGTVGRWARLKMVLMAFGLLMWSVAKRDVSEVPAGCLFATCHRKSAGVMFREKSFPSSKYWLPIVGNRLAHVALFGSAGGLIGLYPTWQKPHAMPMRYGGSIALRSFRYASRLQREGSNDGLANRRRPTIPEGWPGICGTC